MIISLTPRNDANVSVQVSTSIVTSSGAAGTLSTAPVATSSSPAASTTTRADEREGG